jgi:predicted transcriptional regulator
MSTVDADSPKNRLLAVLQDQPEDSSYEELLREMAFASMVDRGLKDADAGNVVSNEEALQRIRSWRK